MLRKFLASRHGGVAVAFAIGLPVLATAVGAAVEYGSLAMRKMHLQSAVDSAALAGAAQLRLARMTDSEIAAQAQNAVLNMAALENGAAIAVSTDVLDNRSSLQVRAEETVPSVMGKLMSLPNMTLVAQATAKLSGTSKLCLLTLEAKQDSALNLGSNSLITAEGCSVYSNSTGKNGMKAGNGARATASLFCSAGGANVKGATVTPAPLTDCPVLSDPLASLSKPSVGGCTATNMTISGSQTLYPGTYCKGLNIKGSASVTLSPGVYAFDDGPLVVSGSAALKGSGVGLYFTGNAGGLRFDPGTTIDLTAPTSGEMAGVLMFENRTVSAPVPPPPGPLGSPPPPPYGSAPMREYRISSNNAANLLGTIYLPAGRLIVDAAAPVANKSAYTVVVTRQIEIDSGPNLYLNSDYASTSVPVPAGVGPTSGMVSLTQ